MKRPLWISLLLVAAASGCGQHTGGAGSLPTSAPVAIHAWQRQLDHLHDLIGGSPRERAAAELVMFHRQQDPVTACMRAGGVRYTAPSWADSWRLRDSRGAGASVSLFLEPINDPDFLVRAERSEAQAQRVTSRDQRRANHAYRSLDAVDKARWDAVIKHCHLGRTSGEQWHPAVGYQSLQNAYYGLLGIGDSAAEVHAHGYERCMRAAGIQADTASVLPDAVLPNVPPDQVPATGPGGPLFQKWVATVHHAMRADAACRKSAFLAGWKALDPHIIAWEHAHTGAIAALHHRWEALVTTAEHEPGWDWPVSR